MIETRHPEKYSRRKSFEETQIEARQIQLPPIRRTPFEIFNEWQEEWLTPDRLLFVMFLVTITMQFCIVMILSLIFNESRLPRNTSLGRTLLRSLLRLLGFNLGRPQDHQFEEEDDANFPDQ